MESLNRTPLHDRHIELGAQMVEFGGWHMPIQYGGGIVQEHLDTRKGTGLFDVSHMGRFTVRGAEATAFLQFVLSNNAAALEPEESQYTLIPDPSGGVIDDAYLYRFEEDEFLLVVNAANRERDWRHFRQYFELFDELDLTDSTRDMAMLSLQGPESRGVLNRVIESGDLPDPLRNSLSAVQIEGANVGIGRTGYTGEPLCFELFIPSDAVGGIWDRLVSEGAHPVGLGARDTLRLEAGLPLYGHELGADPEGKAIPAFAISLARYAVSLSPLKGDFIGREALRRQAEAFGRIVDRDFRDLSHLPRMIRPIALTDRGVARAGAPVLRNNQPAGYVTSGTMVPYWKTAGRGIFNRLTGEKGMRAIGLALIDSDILDGDRVEVDIRGKRTSAVVVPYHLRNEAPPTAWPVGWDRLREGRQSICAGEQMKENVVSLVEKALQNHRWRRDACINLIPSEQTASPMVRMLSILDPSGRYAEHKQVKAFREADVFYYQGTEFIAEVEYLLVCELQKYLGCRQVETRVVSGQMANMAVFSALVDFLNRADRKSEQRRLRKVMNNHIIRGGHLSAQPMGALRDFVMRDPNWEKPGVVNFPVMRDNPYRIDTSACRQLMDQHRPELVILGKSMTLHPEPVSEMREMIDEIVPDCLLMADMAHVLGLVGPLFQHPFREGADLVTGSTHKTFFGTQRGIIATDCDETDLHYDLWEAIQRRSFPGSLSNHHLGTLLGLLMAAYEMNSFRDGYQGKVLENAKFFARSLKECGLDVAGDPDVSYTETHQVILKVGYGNGPEIARRLEENNIIVNYQAAPEEEGFTAAGALRMGVQEMTRFGMETGDFGLLAEMVADVILKNRSVKEAATRFRESFLEMKYCFSGEQFDDVLQRLHRSLM